MEKKGKKNQKTVPLSAKKKNTAAQEVNYCYMLQCSDGTYYTGWTNDLNKRLQAHQEGKGAKYTKGRTPVRIVYYETFPTKEEAMRREYEIKHFSRKEKQQLILRDNREQ